MRWFPWFITSLSKLMPRHQIAQDVRREASKEGVVFPLGSSFFLNQERDDTTHLRLAFSSASLAELEMVGALQKLACDRAVGEG